MHLADTFIQSSDLNSGYTFFLLYVIRIVILNCNNILQHYCFLYFDQRNAALVSIKYFFRNIKIIQL